MFCSLIGPQKYCSDYRPYFTIHDSEFKEYTTKTQAPYVHGLNSILNCFLVLKLHCLLHVHCNSIFCNQTMNVNGLLSYIYFYFFRPSVILGVTNPFFAKTLQHWPHIIRIGEMMTQGKNTDKAQLPLALILSQYHRI